MAGSWGCPHEIDGLCHKVNGQACDPGMKGCVLYGRYVFANPGKNARLLQKQLRKSDATAAPAAAPTTNEQTVQAKAMAGRSPDCPMAPPEAGGIYEIELCSGEIRHWQYLGPGERSQVWWRDTETGQEFAEGSLMYAWQIVRQEKR